MATAIPPPPAPAPAAWSDPSMPTNAARPTGVTILAVLSFIGAGVLVIVGLIVFTAGSMLGSLFGDAFGMFGALIGGALGVLFLVLAALYAAVGIGLWTRKAWGWWITIVLSALSILSGLVNIVRGNWGSIVSLAISGFIVWYLLELGVQRWFAVGPMKMPWHKAAM
jgi:hypothetical protein